MEECELGVWRREGGGRASFKASEAELDPRGLLVNFMLISRYTLLNCVSEVGNCLRRIGAGEIRGPKLVTSDFRFQWTPAPFLEGLLGFVSSHFPSPKWAIFALLPDVVLQITRPTR